MKKELACCFICILFGLNMTGQEFVLDNTKLFGPANFYQYNSFDDDFIENFSKLRYHAYSLKSDGKDVKNNKTYDRIDFKIDGIDLYSKNVKYKKDGCENCFPKSDMYYASNDQLYYRYNPELKSNLMSPTFHENGNLWNVSFIDKDDSEVEHFIVLDKDGNTYIDMSSLPNGIRTVEHPKYGTAYVAYVPAKKPSFYPSNTYFNFPSERQELMKWTDENIALYYGYDHIGSFINNMWGYTVTGFMLPTKFNLGNGSVLFLEDHVSNKTYWAVILDQEIKFKIEVNPEEKPDVIKLFENTDFEVYDKYIVSMKSKNIDNLNGYGIRLVPEDHKRIGDGLSLEVGMFKNGKLHGIGYKTNMIHGSNTYSTVVTIDASYGLFENGQPVNVKQIKANNEKVSENFWDPVPVEGFTYIGKKSNDLFLNASNIKISQLKKDAEVYIKSINRTATIKSVHPTENYIVVHTDTPNTSARLDLNSGTIYIKDSYLGDSYSSCPKVIKVPVSKEEQKSYFVPAEYKSNSYVVKGVYYDKHVSSTTYKPATIESKTVRYTVNEDQVCPRCDGTGYVKQGMEEKHLWRNIQF